MTTVQLLSASVLVPAFIGTIYFLFLPEYGKMFVWFIYATLISEIVSIAFAALFGNNMVVFYFYSSAVALCIGVAYSKILKRNLKIFYLVPIVAIAESFVSGYTMFNSFSFTVLNLLIIGVVLITYFKMMALEISDDIFYFNGALMFGAMTNLICYFCAVFAQKQDMDLMRMMFGVHNWTNMVTNLVYGYSLWKLSKSYSGAR
jgi:hypothetical protein